MCVVLCLIISDFIQMGACGSKAIKQERNANTGKARDGGYSVNTYDTETASTRDHIRIVIDPVDEQRESYQDAIEQESLTMLTPPGLSSEILIIPPAPTTNTCYHIDYNVYVEEDSCFVASICQDEIAEESPMAVVVIQVDGMNLTHKYQDTSKCIPLYVHVITCSLEHVEGRHVDQVIAGENRHITSDPQQESHYVDGSELTNRFGDLMSSTVGCCVDYKTSDVFVLTHFGTQNIFSCNHEDHAHEDSIFQVVVVDDDDGDGDDVNDGLNNNCHTDNTHNDLTCSVQLNPIAMNIQSHPCEPTQDRQVSHTEGDVVRVLSTGQHTIPSPAMISGDADANTHDVFAQNFNDVVNIDHVLVRALSFKSLVSNIEACTSHIEVEDTMMHFSLAHNAKQLLTPKRGAKRLNMSINVDPDHYDCDMDHQSDPPTTNQSLSTALSKLNNGTPYVHASYPAIGPSITTPSHLVTMTPFMCDSCGYQLRGNVQMDMADKGNFVMTQPECPQCQTNAYVHLQTPLLSPKKSYRLQITSSSSSKTHSVIGAPRQRSVSFTKERKPWGWSSDEPFSLE